MNTSGFAINSSFEGNYLMVDLPAEPKIDTIAWKAINNDCPHFLIKPTMIERNDSMVMKFKLVNAVALAYSDEEMNRNTFLKIAMNLLNPFVTGKEWFLNYRNYCIDMHYVYLLKETNEVLYIYIPEASYLNGEDEILKFMHDYFTKVRILDDDSLQLKLYRFFEQSGVTLSDLYALIKGEADKNNNGYMAQNAGYASQNAGYVAQNASQMNQGYVQAQPQQYVNPASAAQVQTPKAAPAAAPAQTPKSAPAQAAKAAPTPAPAPVAKPFVATPVTPAASSQASKPVAAPAPVDPYKESNENIIDDLFGTPKKETKEKNKKEKVEQPKPEKKEKSGGFFGFKKKEKAEPAAAVQAVAAPAQQPVQQPVQQQAFGGYQAQFAQPMPQMNSFADDEATAILYNEPTAIRPHFELINSVVDGALKMIFLDPNKDHITIGRQSSSEPVQPDVAFPSSCKVIGRKHARIEYRNGKFYIIDLGSKNKTLYNGQELMPNVPVELQMSGTVTFAKDQPINYRVIIPQ